MHGNIGTSILSLLAIVFGIAIITITLGDFLIRLAIALIGLWFINYGLRMRGVYASRLFTARFFGGGPFDSFYR